MAAPVSAAPPTQTKALDEKGFFVSAWVQVFTNWFASMRTPANTVAPPAHANSPGLAGQIAYDQNFFYTCVATNTWKRAALTAF